MDRLWFLAFENAPRVDAPFVVQIAEAAAIAHQAARQSIFTEWEDRGRRMAGRQRRPAPSLGLLSRSSLAKLKRSPGHPALAEGAGPLTVVEGRGRRVQPLVVIRSPQERQFRAGIVQTLPKTTVHRSIYAGEKALCPQRDPVSAPMAEKSRDHHNNWRPRTKNKPNNALLFRAQEY